VIVYKIRKIGLTFACRIEMGICDSSTVKIFFDTYFIVKFDVPLPLIPIVKSFVLSIVMSSAMTWSSGSIFIFWEVRYALGSTDSSATKEKAIASMLPVSSEIVRGSLYLHE
jgi:hypothetical protein